MTIGGKGAMSQGLRRMYWHASPSALKVKVLVYSLSFFCMNLNGSIHDFH